MRHLVLVLILTYYFSGCDSLRMILDDQKNQVKKDCLSFSIGFINGIGSESYRVNLKFDEGEMIFPKKFKVAVDDSLISDFSIYLWDTPFTRDSIHINNKKADFDEEIVLSYHFTAKSYFQTKMFSLHFDDYAKCKGQFIEIDSKLVTK